MNHDRSTQPLDGAVRKVTIGITHLKYLASPIPVALPEWFDVNIRFRAHIKDRQMIRLEMILTLYPEQSIWAAEYVAPARYKIDCLHAWSLNKVELNTIFRLVLQHLARDIDPLTDTLAIDIPVDIDTQARKPVLLLDNDVGYLKEGVIDAIGCLQGRVVVDAVERATGIAIQISGIFLNHHFIKGKITYVHSDGVIQVFTIDSFLEPMIVSGSLSIWNPLKPLEKVIYVLNFKQFGHHYFTVDTDKPLQTTIMYYQLPEKIQFAEYKGYTKNLMPQGKGKRSEWINTPNERKETTEEGDFEEGILKKPRVKTTYLKNDSLTSTSTITFKEYRDSTSEAKVTEERDTQLENPFAMIQEQKTGYLLNERFIRGKRIKTCQTLEGSKRYIDSGEFNQKEELETIHKNSKHATREIYMNDRLTDRQIGYFKADQLTEGTHMVCTSEKTQEYFGKWRSMQAETPDYTVIDNFFDDPKGILYCSTSESVLGEWTQGFEMGKAVNSAYHLIFDNLSVDRKLVSIKCPSCSGAWTLTKQLDENFLYESKTKKDKKQKSQDKEAAISQWNVIEGTLIALQILKPPHSFQDLIQEENREKRENRAAQLHEKKEAREKRELKLEKAQLKSNAKAQRKEAEALAAKQANHDRIKEQQAHEAAVHAKKQNVLPILGALNANTPRDPVAPLSSEACASVVISDDDLTTEEITPPSIDGYRDNACIIETAIECALKHWSNNRHTFLFHDVTAAIQNTASARFQFD